MYGECGLIQWEVAVHDLAVVPHEQQVAHPDVPEMHAERVDPEMVGQLGIACGDVPGDSLVEAEAAEKPERGREVLFAVQPLFLDAATLLRQHRGNIAARESLGLLGVGVGHDSP